MYVTKGLASMPCILTWLRDIKDRQTGLLTHSLHSIINDLNDGKHLEVVPESVVNALARHGWIIDHQQQVPCIDT